MERDGEIERKKSISVTVNYLFFLSFLSDGDEYPKTFENRLFLNRILGFY